MTLYFEPLHDLTMTALAGTIEELKERYGIVSERFPQASWSGDKSEGIYVNAATALPFPSITFMDPESGSELSFQNDRFSVTWSFDSEDESSTTYPGYEQLKAMLLQAFDIFSTAAVDVSTTQIQVQRAESLYSNEIPEMDGSRLTTLLLTGRDDFESNSPTEDSTYWGARVSSKLSRAESSSSIKVGVDASADSVPRFWLRVTSSPSGEGLSSTELLDESHAVLIGKFRQVMPDKLIKSWGRES